MKIEAILLCRNGEPRAQLRKTVWSNRQIQLVAECHSQQDVIRSIRRYSPSLILLEPDQGRGLSHIAVRSRGRTTFVKIQDLDYLEAAHNNIVLHVGPARHVMRGALGQITKSLPPEQFFRVNRAIIVNLDRVAEVRWSLQSRRMVVLQTGEEFGLTRHVCIREIRQRLQFRQESGQTLGDPA